MSLPIVTATRYVLPLREGGSLPGVVEGNDLGTYVIKFHGAGQGPKALVAEIIVGELYRRLGLRVPELKLMELDPVIGKSEPDEEIQDLLVRSAGLNLAVDFLPGSFGYDGSSGTPDDTTMARILWLDAYVANVDRSWRNPNLLVWHKELWLIDHGATLLFHHSWMSAEKFTALPYDTSDHVFRDCAPAVPGVDAELAASITHGLLTEVVALVPGEWLENGDRDRYVEHLLARLADRSAWLPGGAR
ncbi:MAG TPA: HipA family kinase [Kribbella sp.]|nr:HipA family kinase [Kribbella sp.]